MKQKNQIGSMNVAGFGLFVLVAACGLLAGCGGDSSDGSAGVEERTAPVGEVDVAQDQGYDVVETEITQDAPVEDTAVAEPSEPPALTQSGAELAAAAGPGKDTYDAACGFCHTTGAAGAPKMGDAEAWAQRKTKGIDALYDSAINGFTGDAGIMPPKGGRQDLPDEDIQAAVDYILANSG